MLLGGVVIFSRLPHRHCSGELLGLYYFVGEEEGCELTFHELSMRVTVKKIDKIPVVRLTTFLCSTYAYTCQMHHVKLHTP